MRTSPISWLRNRTLPLLLSLVGLIALHPAFVAAGGMVDTAFPILVITVPLLGLWALGSWKKALPLVILFIVMVTWAWVGHDLDQFELARSSICYVSWAYYIYAILALSSELFKNAALLDDRVYGGVAIYLLAALLFASVHRHVSAVDPSAYIDVAKGQPIVFAWDGALYFSIVTITTVGFGDIVPATPWARSAATVEAISGVFITIAFIARLAALPSQVKGHRDSQRPAAAAPKQ